MITTLMVHSDSNLDMAAEVFFYYSRYTCIT